MEEAAIGLVPALAPCILPLAELQALCPIIHIDFYPLQDLCVAQPHHYQQPGGPQPDAWKEAARKASASSAANG